MVKLYSDYGNGKTLTDGSNADTLHRHTSLSVSSAATVDGLYVTTIYAASSNVNTGAYILLSITTARSAQESYVVVISPYVFNYFGAGIDHYWNDITGTTWNYCVSNTSGTTQTIGFQGVACYE